ncbi:hypothetical protein ES702_02820 [subsurface metagenome]
MLTKSGVDLPFRSIIGEVSRLIVTQNALDLTLTIGSDIVDLATAQSLANKTLESTCNVDAIANVVRTDKSNNFGAFIQSFQNTFLRVLNPAGSFSYNFLGSAILANRNVTLPDLTTDDTFVFEADSQNLTNKVIDGATNTLQNIPNGSLDNLPVLGTNPSPPRQTAIVNSEIDAGANIGYTKLDLNAQILDTDLVGDIPESKLLVAVGGAGTVLTSNGIGIAPTYQAGGAGDMLLAGVQTNTGAKTFEHLTLLLRNIADTFNGRFAHTSTADRVWTMPDSNGIVTLLALAQTLQNKTLDSSCDVDAIANVVRTDKANTFADGLRQTFDPSATNSGINIGGNTVDPSALIDADIWLNTTLDQLKYRANSITRTLASLDDTQTFLNKTIGSTNTILAGAYDALSIDNNDISATALIAYSKLATLTSGNILVGSAGNVATSVNPSGDIDVSNTGLFSINPLVIVNGDISASANIAKSKISTSAKWAINQIQESATPFAKLRTNSVPNVAEWYNEKAGIVFVIDGGGSAITTGIKGFIRIPYGASITRVTLLADVSGSIVVDINKYTSLANYNSGTKASITSSTPPTLSSAKSSEDTSLTSWTTTIPLNDILEFEVDSATTVTKVTVIVEVTKQD